VLPPVQDDYFLLRDSMLLSLFFNCRGLSDAAVASDATLISTPAHGHMEFGQ
jgi:hypothetical protein